MQPRFDGKTFMVTGAGTGFGAALSLRAAQEGAGKVIVHYRSSSGGRRADRGARAARPAPRRLSCRATSPRGPISSGWRHGRSTRPAASTCWSTTSATWHPVRRRGREVTEEAIDHVLAVDIKGTMLMVHEFGQRMVERGGGAIVNVGSTVIVRGSPRAPQYAAGKYGLLGITKSYAKALAPHVRVNTFAPGFMETEALLNRPEWKAGRARVSFPRDTRLAESPSRRTSTGAALFLASDDAASHHRLVHDLPTAATACWARERDDPRRERPEHRRRLRTRARGDPRRRARAGRGDVPGRAGRGARDQPHAAARGAAHAPVERLVEAEPNRRVRVAPMSAADLEELCIARITLEAEAMRLSVPRLTPENLARLEGYMAEMAHYAQAKDYRRWTVAAPATSTARSPRPPASGSTTCSGSCSITPSATGGCTSATARRPGRPRDTARSSTPARRATATAAPALLASHLARTGLRGRRAARARLRPGGAAHRGDRRRWRGPDPAIAPRGKS